MDLRKKGFNFEGEKLNENDRGIERGHFAN